jgi:hypothetical protein
VVFDLVVFEFEGFNKGAGRLASRNSFFRALEMSPGLYPAYSN